MNYLFFTGSFAEGKGFMRLAADKPIPVWIEHGGNPKSTPLCQAALDKGQALSIQ